MSETDTTPERCPVCDAVLATEADNAEWLAADCPLPAPDRFRVLCWSRIDSGCGRPPVDWRARAHAAEAERDRQVAEAKLRERADILDWLRYPPGRLPDRIQALVQDPLFGEFVASIQQGKHEGHGRR